MNQAADEAAILAMRAAIAEVIDGNLRARVQLAEGADSSKQSLADDINQLITAWRNSELQARKGKRALEEKIALIETQAVAIRELSAPIMQIWTGILLVPVVGSFDGRRSSEITEELLWQLTHTQSSHVIVDVTGVAQVDTSTADHLLRLVRSAKLLGARCVVTGVSPAVARTLTELDANLSELVTRRTLEMGLMFSLGKG